ncbi:NRDE family protein [Spongiibacter marinus]|uniref:NRDE family protein n=1 Tax=Spongiibacter marinus TaxID=354246 RepID=UPI003C4E6009
MCLILLSWQQQSARPLIVAANRDEFFERPTLPAHFWPESPHILAGRDQQFGGSWLGLSTNGRFAAITNLRNRDVGDQSRGELVRRFLDSNERCSTFFDELETEKYQYRPFNFIAFDGSTLVHSDNISSGWKNLEAGTHCIGNIPHTARSAKTDQALAAFKPLAAGHDDPKPLLAFMQDDRPTVDSGDELQKMLSCRFVRSPTYGTRSTSVVFVRQGGAELWEQGYDSEQRPAELRQFQV